ncbi:hypothetical protein E2C01_020886 [Portunus trituberculatus]|uniref:Uncharacterized protein n=1 Tax=Portunus trituberculatus TaxID=210409 RepID=A0A5B7E1S9_PORTR|nr:hypothetical protein [Portunus trituberculatus]
MIITKHINTLTVMAAGGKRSSYTISYKQQVVDYAIEDGNRTVARAFGLPHMEKIIPVWQHQEGQLKNTRKDKHNLHCLASHWPELEDDTKIKKMSDHAKRLYKCCEESDTVGTTQYSYSSDTDAPVDIFASSSSSSSQDSPTGSSYISYNINKS